ncbi:unnamed protein product [Sphagnum jensenii]|uniref:VQ domain-containing protein n=1 Tax=Sphagnum jensenii TaxID=128206 RepID=A0ABP1AQH6_9BRYO
MASADYGSGYRAVIKELGEWPAQLGHNSACAGIVTHAAASPASKYISRQQLVQQLLAQMAASDPRGAGRAATPAGSTVSLESATSSQDESSKMLRNHGNASPTSFDATESCRLSTLVVLGSSRFHESQTPCRSQAANQKHYEPSKTYEQAGWNPQRVPDQGSSYYDSLGMRRSLSASWEYASPAASSRGNTTEPKFLAESSTRRQHSRRVSTTTKLMVAKNSTEFRALVQKLTGLKPEICRHELAVGSTDHQQDATPTLEQQELQPMKLQRTATATGDAAVTPTWWNMSSEEAELNPAQLQLVTGIHASHNNNIITTSTMPMDVDEYMVSSAAAAVAAHEPRFNNSEAPTTTTTTGIINTSTTLNDIDHDQINAAVQDHDLLPYSQIEAMWLQQQQQLH